MKDVGEIGLEASEKVPGVGTLVSGGEMAYHAYEAGEAEEEGHHAEAAREMVEASFSGAGMIPLVGSAISLGSDIQEMATGESFAKTVDDAAGFNDPDYDKNYDAGTPRNPLGDYSERRGLYE